MKHMNYELVALILVTVIMAACAVSIWGCRTYGWFNCKVTEGYIDPIFAKPRFYPYPGGYGDERLGDNIYAGYPVAYNNVY